MITDQAGFLTEQLQDLGPNRFTESHGRALLHGRRIENRRRGGRQALGRNDPVNGGKWSPFRARQPFVAMSGGHQEPQEPASHQDHL